jgi:hypothetical protein
MTARPRLYAGSADTFEPAHAVILQNKDELKIPLMLEQVRLPARPHSSLNTTRITQY